MKRTGILISLFLLAFVAQSQVTGSFTVNGNINTYYMVSFNDPGFSLNAATDLTIGRSNISQDASWRGAIIAKFRYHVTNWGHGANFINAEIAENPGGVIPTFVGGWQDVTIWSGADSIVIWLRGGGGPLIIIVRPILSAPLFTMGPHPQEQTTLRLQHILIRLPLAILLLAQKPHLILM